MRTDIPRKDGSCEISLQSFINKKRKVIGLNIFLLQEEFDKQNQKVVFIKNGMMLKKEDADDYNLILRSHLAKANSIIMDARVAKKILSVSDFERQFNEINVHFDFYTFYDREINNLIYNRNKSTISSYKNTLKWLKQFRSKLEFSELNQDFAPGIDKYFRVQKSMHINTAWKHHRNIKFFCNIARNKKLLIEDPYKNFKVKRIHVEKEFIVFDDVIKLLELYNQNSLRAPHQRSLRIFLFACFTGLRISDVFNISADMIKEDTLIFPMQKARHLGKICRVPLNEMAKSFLQNNFGYIFDLVSEKQVNIDLKEIARLAEVNQRLTFHIARHTFAVQFLLSDGKLQDLQKILGHSSITTTMQYVHVTDSMKKDSIIKMDERFKILPKKTEESDVS